MFDSAQAMGDDNARTFQFGQTLGDDMLTDIVECRCRLVEEEDLRLSYQCPRDEDALPLSARDTLPIYAYMRLHAQRHLLYILVKGRHSGSLPGIVFCQQRVVEGDIVEDGTLNESVVLQTDADAELAETAQINIADIILIVEDGSGQRVLQAQHQSHECALTTTRGSDKCHVVTAVDA